MSSVQNTEHKLSDIYFSWFATQVDRDYITGKYGNGIRLYGFDTCQYMLIQGVSYDPDKNIIVVKNSQRAEYSISKEPSKIDFKQNVYNGWKKWDAKNGVSMGYDRTDYEPWMIDSIKSLAVVLNVYTPKQGEQFPQYYNKHFMCQSPMQSPSLNIIQNV